MKNLKATQTVKSSLEYEIRKMSRKGIKPLGIRRRIDLARRFYQSEPEILQFLNVIEMQYVIKPLGGIALG